jgi:MerR family transcriptional regulator, redox-sensitive transcriptional activator SoxR
MNSPSELLTIGDVSRLAGKAASAVRYYEHIGLISAPVRISGRRRYLPTILRTLAIIDTAQRAGLTLDEIRSLLTASPGDMAATERLRQIADRKLPEVRALVKRAELVRSWLEAAATCTCPSLDDCPLFDEPGQLPSRDIAVDADACAATRQRTPGGDPARAAGELSARESASA